MTTANDSPEGSWCPTSIDGEHSQGYYEGTACDACGVFGPTEFADEDPF